MEKKVEVVNIVGITSLKVNINLLVLMKEIGSGEYEPEIFPGLIYKDDENGTTITVFSNGKVRCVGAKKEKDLFLSVENLLKYLENINLKVNFKPEIIIINVVAKAELGFAISLENLNQISINETSYEPEQFPGLILKSNEINSTFLIFKNGKIIITGGKSGKNVIQCFNWLLQYLKKLDIIGKL